MKLAVSITHMDGVLYVNCAEGRGTAQEILYHTQNTVNAAKRHQCDRVLIVVNIVESLGVSFQHLASVAGILGTLPQGTRVAYNRHDVEHQHGSQPSVTALRYTFVMGATKVHGVEVRAFESIHDAREWLGLAALDAAAGESAFHAGIDFAAAPGTRVLAAADGVVSYAGRDKGYGKLVEVTHGNGYVTRYAHNASLLVEAGQTVRRGDSLALMGSTGRSTGTHLHFEVLRDGRPVNPMSFVRR